MHPALHYDLMQARLADLHHQAQRDALAHAARRARRARKQQSGRPVPRLPAVAARRVLTILSARST
jgi:hypothetical protein